MMLRSIYSMSLPSTQLINQVEAFLGNYNFKLAKACGSKIWSIIFRSIAFCFTVCSGLVPMPFNLTTNMGRHALSFDSIFDFVFLSVWQDEQYGTPQKNYLKYVLANHCFVMLLSFNFQSLLLTLLGLRLYINTDKRALYAI